MSGFIDAPSPNFNERKLPVSLIILHYTGMESGEAALQRMCDPQAQVSAHYMVEEDGRVFRLVADDKRAWHAGVSYWHGERDINSASIGIEIVNGGHDFGLPPYPDVQIDAVIKLVDGLMQAHGIAPDRVIGHSDIAVERKDDPGEHFPWRRLEAAGCAQRLSGAAQSADPRADLTRAGYDPEAPEAAVVTAFQRRHRQARIDGRVDAETAALIRAAAQVHGPASSG